MIYYISYESSYLPAAYNSNKKSNSLKSGCRGIIRKKRIMGVNAKALPADALKKEECSRKIRR